MATGGFKCTPATRLVIRAADGSRMELLGMPPVVMNIYFDLMTVSHEGNRCLIVE